MVRRDGLENIHTFLSIWQKRRAPSSLGQENREEDALINSLCNQEITLVLQGSRPVLQQGEQQEHGMENKKRKLGRSCDRT